MKSVNKILAGSTASGQKSSFLKASSHDGLASVTNSLSQPTDRKGLLVNSAYSRYSFRRQKIQSRFAHSPDRTATTPVMQQQRSGFSVLEQEKRQFPLNQTVNQIHSQIVQRAPETNFETTSAPAKGLSVFSHDSTFELVKKFFIYKIMGNDICINYGLVGMEFGYRLFGVRLTNAIIEQTAGTIFTGGVTLDDLKKDIATLEQRNIGSIACYVVEGLRKIENSKLDQFLDFSMDSVRMLTENEQEGHFALKLTAFISTELMEKLSFAQETFAKDILEVSYKAADESILAREQLIANLKRHGITDYSTEELDQLISSVSINGNMKALSRYAHGHLFPIGAPMTPLQKQIAIKIGGLRQEDFDNLTKFVGRINTLADYADQRDCALYVDAEQTFIQAAIESFGQQMTHRYNRGDKAIIMNGYQCYMKRMANVIPCEVKASKAFGFNLGIKLIRGAYMNEERELAESKNVESPVWDDIDATHKCYNDNVETIISSMQPKDVLFLASHNVDSCEKALGLLEGRNLDKGCVRFGQLRGFSDQVTADLAAKGVKTYKYLPFGPTEQVMPYLVRRGQESKQVLREQEYQNKYLKQEIISRLSPF